MDDIAMIDDRVQKLEEVKILLNNIDDKLFLLSKEFSWDYKKLLEEESSKMVTCSINHQHRVPASKLQVHEQKCSWHQKGYSDNDKTFPEYSGSGSSVCLTRESLYSITKNLSSSTENKGLRAVPQTSANFDQNFDREDKLAIYDYVIANTKKQNSYSDLWLQSTEKTGDKREMAPWEIAAAERDAKRRRASYRNKVHTNRKTHTEILREVIETQMEAFKEEIITEKTKERMERHKTDQGKFYHQTEELGDKRKHHKSSSRRSKEDRDKSRNHDKHSKRRERKRSPSYTGSDKKSRSRSHDKYRKLKTFEGRSHSHRSNHTHRRQ